MNAFSIALATEWMKFSNALLPRIATIGLILVAAIVSPVSSASEGEASALAAATWSNYFDMTAGTVATGGLFGFGLVIVWMFGREFTDGTITGLFGLPVSRAKLALSKLALFVLWACATTFALGIVVSVVGLFLNLGPFDGTAIEALCRFVSIGVLTALLTIPFGLVATLSRDYLAPFGLMLGVVILTSLLSGTGLGGWMPYAAPGFWAASAGEAETLVLAIQLSDVVLLAVLFAARLVHRWNRLEL